jgi:Holliday junction resolvase
MPTKSKQKGKAFEREVAQFLSGLYNTSFTRVPDSGAFTGGKNSFRKDRLTEGQIRAHKGDIIPPDEWKYLNIECKSYSSFPFHQLFSNSTIPLLESWIEQTLDAADTGDCNTLIMKFNRIGKYIAYQLPQDFDTYRHINYTNKNNDVWRFTSYDDFFTLNKTKFQQRCLGN